MRSIHRHWLLILPLAVALAPLPTAAAIYKWVDEQGNTHYGSSIPPEYAKQDTQKEMLNERGQTVEIVQEKEKTPEELAEEKRLEEEERARQEALAKQRLHDRLLLNTYDSVDALEMTRDGKLRSIEGMISVAQSQIRERQALLERQRARAADIERGGGKVDEKLLNDIATTEAQIARNEERIRKLRADQEQIRAQANADIARYKELKGITGKSQARQ
ncbi:MAG: DUF4124 domain-containing protein [Gammaproteobacteria bacterium]|nr:DUF4124 domain-containing protein [Gammaproteobacteria bacterium]